MRHHVKQWTILNRLALASVTLLACFTGCAAATEPAKEAKNRPTNRLAKESSPYLLQHAHNPVDWYPWGTEAFARAKKEGKLVFLSIGYSSCHWCHVMERESFDNADVAKLMNDWFVCIKVDREERPDIDNIYMMTMHVVGESGGWPLSIFLTADAKPIIGGTYWPPEDKDIQGKKSPGFKTVLNVMHKWQQEKPERLQAQAEQLAKATSAALTNVVRGKALVDLDQSLVTNAVEEIKQEFDSEHGGFGSPRNRFRGPKFPMPSYLELLLQEASRSKVPELLNPIQFTLEKMARGGIYDQLGGGFHRYTTERTWTVPHFEKMLYDNAQLVEVYARAYQLTGNPLYPPVIRETLSFVERELTAPEGGFYSALDADSGGSEGLCYVWTGAEIDKALGDKAAAALIKKVYGAAKDPNFEGQYHIFVLPRPLAETAREMNLSEEQLAAKLKPLREKLLAVRAQKPKPFLDTKILTSWNGQMIAGYAAAGHALKEPRYVAAAERAASFILKNLRTAEGRLFRTYGARPDGSGSARLNGYLDDYAFLTHGLLCLHDATGQAKWLNEAKSLTDTMVKFHADKESGGFFYTSDDHEKLFARGKDQYDGAQPSGNSVAASNLVRLWIKTSDVRFRELAIKTFRSFAAGMKSNPTGLTTMITALALYLDHSKTPQDSTGQQKEVVVNQGGGMKSDSKVKITAKADPEKPGADGKQVVIITLEMDKGWHSYANPPGLDELASNQTEVTVTAKTKPRELKIEYPEGKEVNEPGIGKYRIYEGKVEIKVTVHRAAGDTSALEISVRIQSCNEKQCLLPATKKITVP